MNLEIIDWNDAWCKNDSQKVKTSLCEPYYTRTVGWVLVENEHGLLVTAEYWPNDPQIDGRPKDVYGLTFIPHTMIVSRTVIVSDTSSAVVEDS